VAHRLPAQGLLAGRAQIDVLNDLALILVVGALQDGESGPPDAPSDAAGSRVTGFSVVDEGAT
jgi:hypothetical protein